MGPNLAGMRLLIALLLGTMQTLSGQNASRPSVQITRVELSHLVSVRVTVFSPEKDLWVYCCGEDADKTEHLCVLPAYLEARTNEGWRRMELKHSGVLGGVPVDRRNVQLIPAGKNHDFSFGFRTDDFDVKRGQSLRVVVTAWPDEQSMRNDEPPIRLASLPFKCP